MRRLFGDAVLYERMHKRRMEGQRTETANQLFPFFRGLHSAQIKKECLRLQMKGIRSCRQQISSETHTF